VVVARENRGLYSKKLGGLILLPVAAGKQRKLVLPMNVNLKYI